MAQPLPLYGLMAEFDNSGRLVDAVKRARADGYRRLDAYTPMPVGGLGEALGTRTAPVAWWTLAGGVFGGGGGLFMEWYANVVSYPLNIGGRPEAAWPAFVLPAFELTVLGATLCAVFSMLVLNRLPRLNHPVFETPRFSLAEVDRFFLCIEAADPHFLPERTRAFLEDCGAVAVSEVPG
ncbi:DUF3341 domain-containing protein [Azospirillum sp. sgz301742]